MMNYQGLLTVAKSKNSIRIKTIAINLEILLALRPSEGYWIELENELENMALLLIKNIKGS